MAYLRSIEYIRGSLGAEIPIGYISGLLYVATRESLGEPVEVLSIAKALDMNESKASRLVSYLSEKKSKNEIGLGLLVKVEDSYDQRKKLVSLTPKGKAFITGLLEIVQG